MSRCTEIVVRNYALAILSLLVCLTSAEDLTLNVNTKRSIAVVSEKFLSVTLDPSVLFSNDKQSDVELSLGMARALAPAYLRIGGPGSNSYVFERGLYSQESSSDSSYTFSEKDWNYVQQWAERSGLNVIASIAPQLSEQGQSWDSRNALELIAFSDRMGYNTSWQLGYECQTRCDVSGAELGREVQRLRSMLDAFPRYTSSSFGGLVVGPDAVAYKTRQQQQFLQEYFNVAASALAAVTWHPDFAGISLEAEGVSMHHDNLATEKDNFYRIVGRHIAKKPLWIAESKPEECKNQFLGALVWARRLGNTAKLGVQVLMRQPEDSNLFKPSPDYWVSVLHKMLVGREVLDVKIATGNRTHVSFYSHCTKPSSRYEKGSLTIFGVNLTPTKISAVIKGLKPKVIHKYILLPGYDSPNRMFAETTLLNNELLSLTDKKDVPKIHPVAYSAEKGIKLKLPSGGIGFWVLPGLKIKTCMEHEEEIADKNQLRKPVRHFEDTEAEKDSKGKEDLSEPNESAERKLKQTLAQKRSTSLKRSSRHREDEREESTPGESRKLRLSTIDLARRDLERLHRLMRKREHQPIKRKIDAIHGMFDKNEDDNKKSEEVLFEKSAAGRLDETKKKIRAKLQEYKANLDKVKKKKEELSGDAIKDLTRERDSTTKIISAEKVIEALTLITKVENALRNLELKYDTDDQADNSSSLNLNVSEISNVAVDQTHVNVSTDPLLDEVLNSEKSKRTVVPSGIEDRIAALYQLLSEEKERREMESRRRRDLDNKRVDNYKPDSQFGQSVARVQIEPFENPTGQQTTVDSEEGDFYGLPTQPPLENFPEGDVYLQASEDSTDMKSSHANQRSEVRSTTVSEVPDDKGETDKLIGDVQGRYVPTEFYENVNGQKINTRPNMKNYGDLWEANLESKDNAKSAANVAQEASLKTGTESSTTKEVNVQDSMRLESVNYYSALPSINNYDTLQQGQYQPFSTPYLNPTADQSNVYGSIQAQAAYANNGGYYTQSTGNMPIEGTSHHRAKRHLNDLETIFRDEMMKEDINNLKDCQCRVIRGIDDCKDCVTHQEEFQAPTVVIPPPAMPYPPSSYYYNEGTRTRREVEATEFTEESNATTIENKDEIVTPTSQSEDDETTTTLTTNVDVPKQEHAKVTEEEVGTKQNLQDHKEPTAIESTTTDVKDQLKLEDDASKKAGNRLPRTVELPSKYVSKTRTSAKSKANADKEKTDDTSSIGTQPTTEAETKIIEEHGARSFREADKEARDQPSKKSPSRDKFSKISKETANVESLIQQENVPDDIKGTNTKATAEKNAKANVESEGQNKRTTKDNERKMKKVEGSTVEPPKSIKSTSSKTIAKPAPTASSLKNNRNNPKTTESRNKPKNKGNERLPIPGKKRQARLTTRSEALAALKREIENKRAKKIIDSSLKIIDSESAKFEEYQRKRRDQLEKLKVKLRAKRDKMLHQYRDELLDAINENPDTKTRKLKRRDLLSDYDTSSTAYDNDDTPSDGDKLAYIMRVKPIRYISDKDSQTSEEKEKDAAVIKIIKPYYESVGEQEVADDAKTTPVNPDDNNNYETRENEKQATPIDIHFDDEIYGNADDQDYKSAHKKRSPYNSMDEYRMNEYYNYRDHPTNYERSEEDSQEYYSEPEQYEEGANYPHVIYNKRGIVPSAYDARYDDVNPVKKQQEYEKIYDKAINTQKQRDLSDHETYANSGEFLETDSLDEKLEYTDKPEYQQHPEFQLQDQLQAAYKSDESSYATQQDDHHARVESVKPHRRKVRRSNLKIFEIDPSVYDEGDLGGLQEYFKPAHRYSSRSYRHDPNAYSRYKREVQDKLSTLNGPLSFSLGLEKSKMKQVKEEDVTPLDVLTRRKRMTDDPSDSKKLLAHKSIKKVIQNYDKKSQKFSKNLRYVRNNSKNSKNERQVAVSPVGGIMRRKRSIGESSIVNQTKKINIINRPDDVEMDEIWSNIIEMRQDENLLKEYDRQKGVIMKDLRESQRNLQKYLNGTLTSGQNMTNASGSTTQTNIETILVDTIPKIETVITGGLKKAENLTGSFENFFETLNEDFEDSTENQKSADDSEEADDGRLSHNVFRSMLGSVKKFFNLISGVTRIFQNQ